MDIGLGKAWVEELRKTCVNKRFSVTWRGSVVHGTLTDVFLTNLTERGAIPLEHGEQDICFTFQEDGSRYGYSTRYRVQCHRWNDGEIRWCEGAVVLGERKGEFIIKAINGEITFKREGPRPSSEAQREHDSSYASGGPPTQLKGLAPGLRLVMLRGHKGVAPALLKI